MTPGSSPVWRALAPALAGLTEVPEALQVSDLSLDSRQITPGAVFFACRGRRAHGLQFARAAVAAGARAVLYEPAAGVDPPALGSVLVRAVPQLSGQLGAIADRFFGAPSAALRIAGITGTNGKTSCAWLLAQALERRGERSAYLGTLGAGRPGALEPGDHTTPDVLSLHRTLARLHAQGFTSVSMEVSSHALDQERCAAVRFHTALFTNLTRDHLDYHGSMRAYGAAKARLLNWPGLALRVINVDDPFGQQLAQDAAAGVRQLLISRRPAASPAGDGLVRAAVRDRGADGLALQIDCWLGSAQLSSRLIGGFNAENLLGVLTVLLGWGVPLAEACEALAQCEAPPGRMQAQGGGALPLALVDYAHTPDALAQALRSARACCQGRLYCVFGCGGERDQGKRALMGRVAAAGADMLILTDDNPRSEDPARITAAILEGVQAWRAEHPQAADARVIHERAEAIGTALREAGRGDVVLVAGKGHERFQQIGAQRRPFSDAQAVGSALRARSAA